MDSTARYRINRPQVITETIGAEAVIVHLTTGAYYSLEGSGATIWAGIEAEAPVSDIVSYVVSHHADAPAATVQAEVHRLLNELLAEDLVAEADGSGSTPLEPRAAADLGAFKTPALSKYTDMQDLILLDPVHEVDDRGWPNAKPDTRLPHS